ncbi:MAG: helix-turn-helix transcriptional regulator [Oscillospiraceae bacterium]|nr:helix-turn-helix transcriptional regulator [Oscillospiraceae bacterium]
MDVIGGKRKLPVLCSPTANGATRYNDILRNVGGISNTMLSKSLKEIEEAGLIKRREYIEVPIRVEYELTEKAARLQPILLELIQWETNTNTV